MYGVIVFIIFSVVGSISTMDLRDSLHLHCVFSRYMLRFFVLNNVNFEDKYYENEIPIFDEDNVKDYGKVLQSHKDIVLAMLDELRNVNSNLYPSDLMMVNLYLSNITGTLNVYSSDKGERVLIYDKSSLRKGYMVNHKMITVTLLHFIDRRCRRFMFTGHTLPARFDPLRKIVNDATPLLKIPVIKDVHEVLYRMHTDVHMIFRQNFDKNKFTDFLPRHMLFYDIMTELSTPSGSTLTAVDGLKLMDDVVVISKVNGKTTEHTVADLLDYVVLNFDGKYLKSYQQQILAATIHPLFTCVHKYIKRVHLTCLEDTKEIARLGNKLLSVISYAFEELDIYPQKVKNYALKMADKLKTIVNYPKLVKDNLFVLNLCSKPMLLNRLKFDSQDSPIVCWKDFEQMVERTQMLFYTLFAYDNSFKIVKRAVDHNEMFQKEPQDCFQSTEIGSLTKTDNKEDLHCRRSNQVIKVLESCLSDISDRQRKNEPQKIYNDEEDLIKKLNSLVTDLKRTSTSSRFEYDYTTNKTRGKNENKASTSKCDEIGRTGHEKPNYEDNFSDTDIASDSSDSSKFSFTFIP